jgi:N-methylhydantoinase A
VIAAQQLLGEVGAGGCLTADMGGTSFDVGLVTNSGSATTDVTVVAQLHLAVPAIDVRSIGAGGGSVAWLDEDGRLHVGPRAVAATVGPACYGRGGTEATVTDADLLLGRIDPAAVLGGRISLSPEAAEAAILPIANRLGVDVISAAAGIVKVADSQMADLVRRMSIERGHDPRGLAVVAFGGAGPLHVGSFAPQLGVREAIVPADAGVFSADGLVRAGWRRVYRRSLPQAAQLDPGAIREALESMENTALTDLAASGRPGDASLTRSLDLRYRRQTHSVEVAVDEVEESSVADIIARFERRYEEIHGLDTGYRAAGVEATTARVYATQPGVVAPQIAAKSARPASEPQPGRRRDVYFDGWCRDVPVFDGSSLDAGTQLIGPAMIDWPTTTLAIHPGQKATVLVGGHVRLTFAGVGR